MCGPGAPLSSTDARANDYAPWPPPDQDRLPGAVLLLAESLVSVPLLLLLCGPALYVFDGGSPHNFLALWSELSARPSYTLGAASIYLVGCYGKEQGKLWFTYKGSATLAKMLALSHPFGTWVRAPRFTPACATPYPPAHAMFPASLFSCRLTTRGHRRS